MINLARLHIRKNAAQGGSVRKIAVMQEKAFAVNVLIAPQMLDPRTEKITRPPNDSMNRISFFQEQFRQVGTILAGDSGYERGLCVSIHPFAFRSGINPRKRCLAQGRTRNQSGALLCAAIS
jgi:hypothetical protein